MKAWSGRDWSMHGVGRADEGMGVAWSMHGVGGADEGMGVVWARHGVGGADEGMEIAWSRHGVETLKARGFRAVCRNLQRGGEFKK